MKIAVFTSGRQDWGILSPVCDAIAATPDLSVLVIAGGMHGRNGEWPSTLGKHPVAAIIDALPDADSDRAIGMAAGETTTGLSHALARLAADSLLIVGDRTETLAAAVAATCLRIPIIHLHGGETTLGAIDDACRHAISKLADIHFVSHGEHRSRLIADGEDADAVHVVGAPALDTLLSATLIDPALIIGPWPDGLVLVCYHPTTAGGASPVDEITAVLDGVAQAYQRSPHVRIVLSPPNCDVGGEAIKRVLEDRARSDPRFVLLADVGSVYWWSLMAHAEVMIGNSSSGIIEAPSFRLPVVNIGGRQRGRWRIAPTFEAEPERDLVADMIGVARSPAAFPRRRYETAYGDGRASERIASCLAAWSHA